MILPNAKLDGKILFDIPLPIFGPNPPPVPSSSTPLSYFSSSSSFVSSSGANTSSVVATTGGGVGENLGHGPAFGAAEGAGLGNSDPVTHAALVAFVVGFVAGGAADGLLIDGVWDAGLDRYHYRFIHLVADDGADPFLECLGFRGGNQEATVEL